MTQKTTLFFTWIIVSVSGCSYAIRQPQIEAGRRFSDTAISRIHAGHTRHEVVALAGEPFEGTDRSDQWRYFMRVSASEERRLLGFIPLPDSETVHDYEQVIKFRNDVVVDVASTTKRVRTIHDQ